ncbi:MAG TPA: hypothetical protein VL463_19110 [Kofleriaceae bacterium]|nr:hypothetical protein [Kofleriaceae bacterium]
MDDALADQIRAYERWLAKTEHAPALHAHQRAAWTADLALARSSRDAADHTARLFASGHASAAAIAPWLDRQAALARIHRALGDLPRAAAHDAATVITGEPIAHMIAHEQVLRVITTDRDTAGLSIGGIVLALLDLRAERDPSEQVRYIAAQLARLASVGLAWSAAHDDPFRRRLPFDRARIDLLTSWLPVPVPANPEPVEGHVPGPQPVAISLPPSPPPSGLPPASLLADSYRAQRRFADPSAHAILDAMIALADACTTAPEVLARLAATPLELELARAPYLARTADAIERADDRGQIQLAAHERARAAALRSAQTPTEVEIAIAHSDACFAIETIWWSVLVHTATHSTAAAAELDRADTPDRRRAAAAATRSTIELLGADFAALSQMAWLAPIVERVLHRLGDVVDLAPPLRLGYLGEVGYPVVAPLRAAAAEGLARQWSVTPPDPTTFAARLTQPRMPTPAALRDHLVALLAKASPSTNADPARRVVRLWDHAIDLADLDAAAAIALRPGF